MLREFQDLQVQEQRVLRKPRWLWGQPLYLSAKRLEDGEWLLIASDAYAAQGSAGVCRLLDYRYPSNTLFKRKKNGTHIQERSD